MGENALVFIALEPGVINEVKVKPGTVVSNIPRTSPKAVDTNADPQSVADTIVEFLKRKYNGRVYRRYVSIYDPTRVGKKIKAIEVGVITPSFAPITAFRSDVNRLMTFLVDKYVIRVKEVKPIRVSPKPIAKPVPVKITTVAYPQGSPEARELERRILYREKVEEKKEEERRLEEEKEKKKYRGAGIIALLMALLGKK